MLASWNWQLATALHEGPRTVFSSAQPSAFLSKRPAVLWIEILNQVQNDGLCRFHGRSQQLGTDNLQPVCKAKKLTGSNINAIVRGPERPRRSWKILPMLEVTSAFESASSKLCSWLDLARLTPSATTWPSSLKGGFKIGIIRIKKQTHARNSKLVEFNSQTQG